MHSNSHNFKLSKNFIKTFLFFSFTLFCISKYFSYFLILHRICHSLSLSLSLSLSFFLSLSLFLSFSLSLSFFPSLFLSFSIFSFLFLSSICQATISLIPTGHPSQPLQAIYFWLHIHWLPSCQLLQAIYFRLYFHWLPSSQTFQAIFSRRPLHWLFIQVINSKLLPPSWLRVSRHLQRVCLFKTS